MDQVKAFGHWMKRNYFWLLCGTVTLLSLGFWFISTSTLRSESQQRRTAIEAKESSANSIRSRANHPNTVTHARMEERNSVLVEDVFAIWNEQFDKQRAILTWPDRLGSEFRAVVSRLQPIEQKVPFPNEREQLSITQRTQYRDFIHMELPNLAKIVGAEWQGGTGSSGMGGNAATMMTMAAMRPTMPGSQRDTGPSYLVDWKPANQKALQGNRFAWPSKRGGVPGTLDVLYAQEDYWIYSAVLEIIRSANGDISHRYQAAVKTIDFIDIGRDAIGVAGKVAKVGEERAAGGMGGMMGGMMDMSSMASMGDMTGGMMGSSMMTGGEGGPAAAPQIDPGDNRYVDLQYEPLTASQIRSAFDSNNPEDAFLMVAKRVPVRMRLKVDQRKLPRLIAECGNAKLQLEVRQVRINTRSGSTARKGAVGGGGMGDMSGMMPDMGDMAMGGMMTPDMGGMGEMMGGMMGGSGMMGSGMMGSGMMGGAAGRGLTDDSPFDVDVELYGIMYIYNPVDREKLGKKLDEPGASESSEPASEAESAPGQPATEAPVVDEANAAG